MVRIKEILQKDILELTVKEGIVVVVLSIITGGAIGYIASILVK